jgi:hypothetical protein
MKRRLAERVVDPAYVDRLDKRSVEELQAMADECREGESEVSFERRLCQARIDILTAEIDNRNGGSSESIIARLPQILSSDLGAADSSLPVRARDLSIPRNTDIPRRRVEEIVGEQTLARLSQVSTEELSSIIESLVEHERSLSERRRQIHDAMDEVKMEIARRYADGEADTALLLQS